MCMQVTALVLVAPAIITSLKGSTPPPAQQHQSGGTVSDNASGSSSRDDVGSIKPETVSFTDPADTTKSSSLAPSVWQRPTSETASSTAETLDTSGPVLTSPSASNSHNSPAPLQSTSNSAPPPQPTTISMSEIVQRSLRLLRVCAASLAALAVLLLVQLLTPFLTLLLRSLVRSKAFWVKGLSSAYQDPTRLTPAMVDHYRLPQLVRGWEQGMINFLASRISHLTDIQGMLKAAWNGNGAAAGTGANAAAVMAAGSAAATAGSDTAAGATAAAAVAAGASATSSADMQLAQRLGLACASGELSVLIVHGKQDRLVPVGNSLRLAEAIPGCQVVLYDSCGHTPQEEMPLEFERDVAQFVNSLKKKC